MANERKGFLLRLPPKLLAELRAWAEADMRSLNGQLEFLLREALERRRGRSPRGEGGDAGADAAEDADDSDDRSGDA